MNDRELLELAAKAAGIEVLEERGGSLPWTIRVNGAGKVWNPLTDDGDALRLAVKLHIDFNGNDYDVGFTNGWVQASIGHRACMEEYGSDPYAATRRAIVRAAAEIGRAM